jgi:hypothetical protein
MMPGREGHTHTSRQSVLKRQVRGIA